MSINVAQGRLQQMGRDLMIHWKETQDLWSDNVTREFDARYIAHLESRCNAAIAAMHKMNDILHQARSECR